MNACGLIVEYNPFHNGHKYHLQQSKEVANADCMIAVMSGNFLQRGEPAIIDKYHRTKAAISQGIDLVIELPFAYAVQHSDLFAKGAVLTLGALGVKSLCFGSEHGNIDSFTNAYHTYTNQDKQFNEELRKQLSAGLSFPEASKQAYHSIGLTEGEMDLSQPNNILGFSYVKSIFDFNQTILPLTIQRIKNDYHDQSINDPIASATSIRKQLNSEQKLTSEIKNAIPGHTKQQLTEYRSKTGFWHEWQHYFQLLNYRVLTMSLEELRSIHGVDEGLEYRIKNTAYHATSFKNWMENLKTKRYTWTRLQRIFTHILTNTKSETIISLTEPNRVPYIRLLGMSQTGQAYLNKIKKHLDIPIVTSLNKSLDPMLQLEEQVSSAYYSILSAEMQIKMRKQKLLPPYILLK
ncbi:nucleotidyltransferase [Aquibacillus sediminis]|uniref:nucleotidyltransferase n=1 Tax=Aquibacillus sediminis TaxID=2574734 RepID=UPI001108B740|nr:nucleotidyltransferase [Aquibacillus sediminis]